MRQLVSTMRRWVADRIRTQYDPDVSHRILTITDNGGGLALLTLIGPRTVTTNDVIVVRCSSVAAYNTTHTVTATDLGANSFSTDQSYTSAGAGGYFR